MMPDADDELLQALAVLIGREGVIENRQLRVVEILRSGPSLVLGEIGADAMQESLYGQARRRAPRHFQVALRSEIGQQLHPVARALLNEEEQARFLRLLFTK